MTRHIPMLGLPRQIKVSRINKQAACDAMKPRSITINRKFMIVMPGPGIDSKMVNYLRVLNGGEVDSKIK